MAKSTEGPVNSRKSYKCIPLFYVLSVSESEQREKIFFIPFFRVNELLQSASRFIPSNFPTDYIAISCMTVDHSALIPPQFHLWLRGGCAVRIDAQGLNKRLRESLRAADIFASI